MIPTQHQQLWQKIEAFSFDEPGTTITFAKKLCNKQGWTAAYTERVIEEYRRFMLLCCISPTGASPSHAVDEAWHLHLTYTQSYWNNFCKNTLGKDIHHYPSTGGTHEDQKHADWYKDTLQLYESIFGEPAPSDIWTRRNEQPLTVIDEPLLIESHQYTTSKQLGIVIALLLIIPFVINYILAGIASPYSVKGTRFLAFYAFLTVGALIAHYLLQKDKLAFMRKAVAAWKPTNLSVYQLTYAVYGKHRAVQTGLVDLYRRNLLSVNDSGKMVVHKSNYQAPEKEDNPLVPRLLVKADGSMVEYNDIADDWYRQEAFDHAGIQQLHGWGDQKESFLKKYWIVGFAFLIGVLRVIQGIYNDRPVLLLLLEMLVLAGITIFIEYRFSTTAIIQNKIKKLMGDTEGNSTLHADNVVTDYARNGSSVLDWLPAGLMLGSMFALFPITSVASSPMYYNDNSSSGDWNRDSNCSSGSSCSSGSDSSCGGGSSCGGCGGSD